MSVPNYFQVKYDELDKHPSGNPNDKYEKFLEVYTEEISQFLKNQGETVNSLSKTRKNTQDKLEMIYEALYGKQTGGKRRSKKTRKATRKGRKATRKIRGGALETINATSLNGVRETLDKLKPRLVGLFIREGKETKLSTGRIIYTDKQVASVETKNFDKMVENHKVTNDNLVKNHTTVKPNDKGKYFFQYV